jgi:hypothetical protein
VNVHSEPGELVALAGGGIGSGAAGAITLAALRFTLFEHGGVPHAWVDLALQAGVHVTLVRRVLVIVPALARNDGSAIMYPREFAAILDDAAGAPLTAFLLLQLRMLTRGRVVPLACTLHFAACPAFERYLGAAST